MCVGEVGGGGNGDGATSAVPPCPITPTSPQVDKEGNLQQSLHICWNQFKLYFQMTKWSLFVNVGGWVAGYENKEISTLLKAMWSIVCKYASLDLSSNNATHWWPLSVLCWKLIDSEEWGCGWIAPLNNFPFPRSGFLTLRAHHWTVHRQQSYNTLSDKSVLSFALPLEFSNLSLQKDVCARRKD